MNLEQDSPESQTLPLGHTGDGVSFALPRQAATQRFAFLARPGAGKTYAATRLAELFHHTSQQFVALDPVGVWYGLRLAADGESPGLPVPVFGGEFGDIPLEPSAGALVADLVVERGISLILDVSSFRKGQRKQFATDFAEQLFHRKKTARSPVHLFLEEAQVFVPQRTISGEERMLGAFEDLAKIGRNYGIGLSLISQRPASVNKDVLNLTEALVVLQMNAAQDRKAIRDWIDAQGIDAAGAVNELPLLAIGEAFVWSPQWLKFFGKVRIGEKATYNASATPTFDTPTVVPRPLEAGDLAALREAMQTVVTHAQQHDPTALQRRIKDLTRQLAERDEQAGAHEASLADLEEQLAERDEQLAALEEQLAERDTTIANLAAQLAERGPAPVDAAQTEALDDAVERLDAISAKLEQLFERAGQRLSAPVAAQPAPAAPAAQAAAQPAKATAQPVAVAAAPVPAPVVKPPPPPPLPAAQQHILDTLALYATLGLSSVDREHVARWSDYSPRSSSFGNLLSTMRNAGLVTYPYPGEVAMTAAGRQRARTTRTIGSRKELHAVWFQRLASTQVDILKVLINAYPEPVERSRLARAVGYTSTSRAVGSHLSALRSLGLIASPVRSKFIATTLLFPHDLP